VSLSKGLICCWQATPAVCHHKDTGATPDKKLPSAPESLLFPLLSYATAYLWNYKCCPDQSKLLRKD